MTPACVWPLAAELAEGPLWWDGALWFTSIKGRKIHRFDPATRTKQSWDAPAQPGFLAPMEDGGFIAGLQTGLHRFDPVTGAFDLLCAVEPQLPGNRLNDGAVDGNGRLWFGSMDDTEKNASGAFYCFERGKLRLADPGYRIPNGPAFSPDGRTLYHTDTAAKETYAFDLGSDGALTNKRVFARIEDGAGWPDGSVADAGGFVWTGLWGGWGVRRHAPDGRVVQTIALPVAQVTKIAFGGGDLRDVYVTSAWKGLNAQERAAQPLAGGIFHFRSDTPGQRQNAVLL